MKTPTRLYVVKQGDVERVIRAKSAAAAKSFAASDIVSTLATQADLERLFTAGIKAETAGAAPATTPTKEPNQ